MEMTKTEVEAQLLTVNAAIQQLVAGERLNQLRVGSSTFSRLFVYSEVMLSELREYQAELMIKLRDLSGTAVTFRQSATVPLIVSKFS